MDETTNETIAEDVSVLSEQVEYTDSMVGEDYFHSVVSELSIDDQIYCIVVTESSGLQFTFPIPNEYASSIFVIDGQIYNLGSETIKLCTNLPDDDYYYRVLELPVYKSEEDYKNISISYKGQKWGEVGVPYRMYGITSLDQDHRDQIITESIIFENPTYEVVGSQMNAWSLDTIFVFIIMVLLIFRTVFRKR